MLFRMSSTALFPIRLISWNVTLRCPLSCPHCYSDSGDREVSDPLTTREAFGVLDQIRQTGTPVVILSGGEPMMREDILAIARYGTDLGLVMAMGTSGYLITDESPAQFRQSGIRSVAISLDSADPAVHDKFRGSPGAFDRAVHAIRICISKGIRVQLNITVITPDPQELDRVVALGRDLGVRDFQVFIPVPTGRSRQETDERYQRYEALVRHILTSWTGTGISLRPTCFPQFRRIADEMGIVNPGWGRGCIAGISYCRIYPNGDVTPCPYLPAIAGNLRKTPFADLWAESPVFSALRDPDRLLGKCGECGYKAVCGGCRARAFSRYGEMARSCGGLVHPGDIDGELCGEDPVCPYLPGGEA